MTTLDFLVSEAPIARRPSLLGGLRSLLMRHRRRRDSFRSFEELSRMDARLLRDMGIEPLDVEDALNDRRRSILFNPMRRSAKD